MIDRRRTCHRGRRRRREHSDNDRHKRQATTAKPTSNPASSHAVQKIAIPRQATRTLGVGRAARPPRLHPVIVAAVAVLYVALAAANGGYSSELTAGATVGIWWAWRSGWRWARGLARGFPCCRGRRRMPRRVGRLDGDLHRLGKRCRRRLRRGRQGPRLPRAVRAGRHRVPPGERPHVARAASRSGLVVVAGLASREPLRAVVRRQPGPQDLPSVRRRQAQLSDRLLERPRRGDGRGHPPAGLARRPRPGRVAAGGRGGRDPVAGPGHLLRLLARRRLGRLWPGSRSSWRSARAARECSRAL